jgi:cysteine synthase A
MAAHTANHKPWNSTTTNFDISLKLISKSVILNKPRLLTIKLNHIHLKESFVGQRYANILETVGNTPVVRINKLAPPDVNLFVKIEAFNPLGSVKDRLALGVIEDAEKTGKLKPGQTVIEATSGNTGIGLAMVCAQKGYPLVVTMAETFSVERRKLMRFLGAKVVLTPAAARGTGMVAKAIELAEKHGWFLTRQFENEANADFHSRTTAKEILEDFKDERLDYWVTGFGTGGTLKGVARVLAKERPETKIVLCEPDDAPMVSSGIEQPRNHDGSPSAGHPSWKPHPLQGWSPDFIAKLTGDAVETGVVTQFLRIKNADAMKWSKELARKEGIFVGISSGATFAAALQVCAEAPKGSSILCMLPDTGERYLSTPLFADIPIEMTAEEVEISRSTPGAWLQPAS